MKKGGVGNADFPWLPLAQVPSRAAAAQARGVLGENYSLISHFTETWRMLIVHLLFQPWLAIFREGFCEVCAKETHPEAELS